jgi:pantetheine-phosphate adenylyltransferase
MKVCFGGTFNIIHKGHELIFQKAFEDDNIVAIGLTSDDLIKSEKEVEVKDYEARKEQMESYFENNGWSGRYSIVPLTDKLGPSVYKDFDAIVVSEETEKRAREINFQRENNNLAPLKIITVKMAYAQNGEVISATKIKRGEMNKHGKLLRKVKVFVGSENPVKINAVKNVFAKVFDDVEVTGIPVQSEVPDQPKEKKVIEGAIKRAKNAMNPESDFQVGIEAGLFWNETAQKYFDVQYCAIIDKAQRITMGHGGGFNYPDEIIEHIKKGKTVGQAVEDIFGIKDAGKKMGAIGYLSDNLLDRTRLTEQAVLMSMIPRMRSELYE